MARGFVYLTAVVDVASRRVLAHKVAITLEAVHAKEVVEQAIARYGTLGPCCCGRGARRHCRVSAALPQLKQAT